MKISDIQKLDAFECLLEVEADAEILDGYTSDLLSDVMANAAEGCVLITIQAHKNTVAVASLVDASAIIICNGRPVSDDMLEAAEAESIAIFRTEKNQFQTSVLIAEHITA